MPAALARTLPLLAAAFVLATGVSALLIPFVRRVAFRVGAVSVPGGRHVHGRVIPRLGGVAIVLSFGLTLGLLALRMPGVFDVLHGHARLTAGLLVGGAAMAIVGVIDDTRGIRALYKLFAQIAVAIFAYSCGFRIDAVTLPFLGELSMGVFGLPITVFWIVGIINAVNLIDGLDGLAAGIVFFAGITNIVVASIVGTPFTALVMATMLGAVLGFLFWNFNPARIFMGDSGSYFLGFVLAATSLVGTAQKASTAVSILVPILALGLPILDTLFSIVRRFLERRPIFSPDRGHIHHRLLDMGITHRRAVLILYGFSAVFTVLAIAASLGRSWYAGLAILGAAAGMLGIVRFVGYFEYLHQLRRQKSRIRTRHTERLRAVLPELPVSLASARDEDDVFRILAGFVDQADLACCELVQRDAAEFERRWTSPSFTGARISDYVSARFPIGEQGGFELRFRWESEFGDVSPQTEVLLQVAVDVIALALTRARSAYAPAPSRPPAEVPRPAFTLEPSGAETSS